MASSRHQPLALLVALLLSFQAQAEGLWSLYRDALTYDPVFAAARAEREAAESLITQTRGQLLPQLGINWSSINNDQTVDTLNPMTGNTTSRDYNYRARSGGLSLTQGLFRPQNWIAYAQAGAQVQQAEGVYRNVQQELILRVSQAYFDVLMAEDNLTLVREQKTAITEQLKQAKRFFEAGVGTITDINEVQARFDTVSAQEIAAISALEVKFRAVEQMVNKLPTGLRRLGGGIQFELPQPAQIDPWLEFARENNPLLKAREAALDVAGKEVLRNAAAHLPTVDLVGGRTTGENTGYTALNASNWNTTIGVQVSIPLFAGGTTQGRTSQAMSLREKATHELEAGVRTVNVTTRTEFLNVVNGVAQVKALEQAVRSNELALYSARKGQEAGMRTSFDVLNAQQLLFTAKRDLAQARYSYAMARLKLKAAAGLLSEEDVKAIDQALENE